MIWCPDQIEKELFGQRAEFTVFSDTNNDNNFQASGQKTWRALVVAMWQSSRDEFSVQNLLECTIYLWEVDRDASSQFVMCLTSTIIVQQIPYTLMLQYYSVEV